MEENIIFDFIERHGLFKRKDRIGAAVSGGADSMVMLVILKKLGYDVTALHFEHGIRGDESKSDMRFVRDFCEQNAIPFVCGCADVPGMRKKGESMETAARRLRYEFFERSAKEHGLKCIATAHHADDNAETVIMNLLRGSGVKGMRGISPVRGIYVRPMLALNRADIESYAQENGISFVTDSTNLDNEYTRNKIRNSVLPVFREINPNYAAAVNRACELAAAQDDAFQSIVRAETERISLETKHGIALDTAELNKMPDGLAGEVIRYAVSRVCPLKDIEKSHYEAVSALVRAGRTGKSFSLDGKFAAFISYNRLIIADKLYKMVRYGEFELALSGSTDVWEAELVCENAEERMPKAPDSFTQYFDAEKLKGAVVRARRQGDVFRGLGASGGKKLKEWMIDKKVPSFLRDGVPLLARGSEVLWIIGFGVGENAKVTKKTKSIVKLTYRPNKNF